ncbi:MAG: 2TM domain-containing protein [Candidatus Lokiarchaeota archaeon]|nr:2TM domain-containing protein [Candidatus Lokiarchaeota archaeon]
MNEVFSEDSLRRIASQKITFRYSVRIHASCFLFVNALLFVINIVTVPDHLWFLYPVLGWQIGLTMHILLYILYARGVSPISLRSVLIHLVGYLSTMILLFSIDLDIMSVGAYSSLEWVQFPAFFWGLVLLLHIFIYLSYFRSKPSKKGEYGTKRERLIEKEMEKMRRKYKQVS